MVHGDGDNYLKGKMKYMTKEQLELLLKYIDMRDSHYNHVAKTPEGYSLGYSDEEAEIREDLRRSLEDQWHEI
jgi:hypothetical protein